MTLRKTILLAIGLALVALILVLFFTLDNTLGRQYQVEEQQNARDVLQRSLKTLDAEFDVLENISRDWAKWDDTYLYVQDGNRAYREANLGGSTYTDLDLELMAFVNLEGRVVFIRTLDPNTLQTVSPPVELTAHLVKGDALLQDANSRDPQHGILVLPGGPMLVVAHPILQTNGVGPAAGTLVIGRYLNDATLQRLRNASQLSFYFYPYGSAELPPEVAQAKQALQTPDDTTLGNIDDATAAAYTLLNDYYGNPGYILRVDVSRAISRSRQTTTTYLTIYLIMAAVIFASTILLLFESLVLSRLARLNQEVNRIGLSGDLSQRVTVQYKDEIANLSRNINQSLASLEQAQRQRQELDQRFRILVESMEDVVFTLDPQEQISAVYGRNPNTSEMIRMIGSEGSASAAEETARRLHHQAFTQALNGIPQLYEWESDFHGQHLSIQSSLSPMRDGHGAVIGVVSVGRDVTRLKLLEQDLQARLGELSALYEASRIFLSHLDLQNTFQATAELAVERLEYHMAWTGRLGEQENQLKVLAAKGTAPEDFPAINLAEPAASREAYLAQQALRARQLRTSLDTPLPSGLPWLAPGLTEACITAAVPLMVEDAAQGLLVVYRRDGEGFHQQGVQLLQSFANLASFALQNATFYEQVRNGRERMQELSYQLVEIQENERQHLAQELHDEIGQLLTGLKILVQTAAHEPHAIAVERLEQANEVAEQLIARVRQMSLDLRPAMLDDLGLHPALVWLFDRYTKQTGIDIQFQHVNLEGKRFPPQVETTAYRVIQEALTNIARHAQVNKARVRVWVGGESLGVQVEDEGRGFEPEEALESRTSRGLIGMRERVERLNGEFSIVSSLMEGTLISAQFPLDLQNRR